MAEQKEIQRTDPEHVEVVAVEESALEVMERAAIDVQIATAHKFPRDPEKFIIKAKELVAVDFRTAESCIYRRPVGKDDSGAGQKYVEGESIRLAEIVAATYGNLRVAAIISEITLRHVKAIGFAHDLESNYAAKAEAVESTVTKNGKPFSERMRIVVAKAAQSKAMRDAIFRVVPKSICKPIIEEARSIILSGGKTINERRKGVAKWIKSLGIEDVRVFTAIGIEGLKDIDEGELETLTGLRTALNDGEITVDEAFPPLNFKEKEEKTEQKIKDEAGSEKVDIDEPEPDKNKTTKITKKKKKKKKQTKPKAESKPQENPEPEQEPTDDVTYYECTSKKCKGRIFDNPEPRPKGDGTTVLICPLCYTSKINVTDKRPE